MPTLPFAVYVNKALSALAPQGFQAVPSGTLSVYLRPVPREVEGPTGLAAPLAA